MGFMSLFGTKKIVENVSDAVSGAVGKGGLIDNAFFTDQEKAQVGLEAGRLWLDVQKVLATENSIRSITRRAIAWAIVGEFLLLLNTGVVLLVLGKRDLVVAIKEFAIAMKFDWMAVTVIGFFFLYYGVQKIVKKEA